MWYKNTINRYLKEEERKAVAERAERAKLWNETIKPIVNESIKNPGSALCAIPVIFIINPGLALLLLVFVPFLLLLVVYNTVKYAFDPNS